MGTREEPAEPVRPRGSERSRRARGQQTLERILDTSVQVFGLGGSGAVTHRAVAKAAGVSLGLTTYYFTDREDLLRQTMAHAQTAEAKRLAEIVDRFDGELSVERSVMLLSDMFLDKTIADPLYDLALFEMFMEATRNPGVRDETRRWSRMIGELTDRVLPPTDPSIPRQVAIQIVATLIDGLMLEAVSNAELHLDDLRDRLRLVLDRLCVVPDAPAAARPRTRRAR